MFDILNEESNFEKQGVISKDNTFKTEIAMQKKILWNVFFSKKVAFVHSAPYYRECMD